MKRKRGQRRKRAHKLTTNEKTDSRLYSCRERAISHFNHLFITPNSLETSTEMTRASAQYVIGGEVKISISRKISEPFALYVDLHVNKKKKKTRNIYFQLATKKRKGKERKRKEKKKNITLLQIHINILVILI